MSRVIEDTDWELEYERLWQGYELLDTQYTETYRKYRDLQLENERLRQENQRLMIHVNELIAQKRKPTPPSLWSEISGELKKSFLPSLKYLVIASVALILLTAMFAPKGGNTGSSARTASVSRSVVQEATVYVTPSGKKYHRSTCQYVKGRDTKSMSESIAIEAGFEPCSVCNP